MHATAALCSRLRAIRSIWSRCWRTCTQTRAHTSSVDARGDNKDCRRLQIHCGDSLLGRKKNQLLSQAPPTPEPKRSSLRTKGQVCGGADISTAPSLTHSLTHSKGKKDCACLNRGAGGVGGALSVAAVAAAAV